jgi:hypothetical protein
VIFAKQNGVILLDRILIIDVGKLGIEVVVVSIVVYDIFLVIIR